ncbi:hypothetical protein N7519_005000 [Penicillium mononematosum]|uniref:uncharacterized protein n=1 Tax=Penicillium mononematosum TaxID=268346 RepID=UPI00254804C6|nr:uncharacterized protein N7519_005000 [Penicillium mononematosum]KAJ6183699.1 hypothetical protein N7519_005000 [Penicillium mononematosum]
MSQPKGQQEEFVETIEPEEPRAMPPNNGAGRGNKPKGDQALQLIEEAGHSNILTPENNAKVLRKIDLRLLPILLGIYFLQQLDKSTISYASVFGIVEKANLHGQQYSWLGGSIYLAQLVFQPLVAYLLVKVPLAKFLAASCLLWGIALTCMTAATNFGELLACRLFLGIFEAGIAPAFIAVTQMWYRRREQPVRLSSWYAMNGVVNMFGSLIAFGLGHIKSSIFAPYQIIFLFFGLVTVGFSAVILIFMPDSPVSAKFLGEEDKLLSIERQRMNQQGVESHEWKWEHTKEAFLDPKSWFWFALMFSISVPSGGITTFGPLIIKSFGLSEYDTMLFNIPFGAVQLVATMGGCVMLLEIAHDNAHKGPLLAGYYIISVYPAITPLIYSWSAANTAGETKKKVTTAILYVGQCAGNVCSTLRPHIGLPPDILPTQVLGPNLYTTNEAPLYRRGLLSNLAMFCVLIGLTGANIAYMYFLNKKHEKKRVALGKDAKIVDQSMQTIQAVSGDAKEDLPQQAADDNSWKDLTDLQNEDFVYVF